ncbi:MAG: single-stranded DNA-binding protein [Candidatus Omnitrophica bacterium]|nr:single-stranded DNA-binding protein [Candidatus Omnitrophota bacterium]MDD5488200.1 single-stranded DNA-binding protein [Candidatus Omnitrophota bacterium]
MAASLNKVFLMGNLTRDPEIRYIPSGTAVANFTVAVNRPYKDTTGEKKDEVSFIRVVVWGKMAEICGEYLTKGRPVLVEGRLKSRTWEAQDGQKRSSMDVVATSVQFLGGKGDRTPSAGGKKDVGAGASRDDDQGYGEVESIDVDQGAMDNEVPF